MHNPAATNRRPCPGLFLRVAFGCALALAVTILPGCASMTGDKKKKTSDPILGEVHPQNTAPYGPTPPDKSKTTADTTGKTSFSVPPMVPSTTSNAYLASMTKPLPGSLPLAIENDSLQLAGNADPLVRPVPRDPAFVNNSWVSPPTTPASGSTGGQFVPQPSNFVDPQVALLTSHGITQHRVDPQADGTVRLIAVAPQRGNPDQVRTYDVNARDFPAAVQAVIQQMDQGR